MTRSTCPWSLSPGAYRIYRPLLTIYSQFAGRLCAQEMKHVRNGFLDLTSTSNAITPPRSTPST